MSCTQYAFLRRTDVPDRTALQIAIDALGFDVIVHPEFTPFADAGFLPFVFKGEEGPGFEIEYQDTADVLEEDDELADDELADAVGDRDVCIGMTFRSSSKDLACVMIVSCALARSFDAVISYERDDPESQEELYASTLSILSRVVDEH